METSRIAEIMLTTFLIEKITHMINQTVLRLYIIVGVGRETSNSGIGAILGG